jgi:SAM-dependent methyltransferase
VVLDAGAGHQPYRKLFNHCRYEAADFEKVDKNYAQSTYVCDLTRIPVEDGRFDAVVLSQVMEHLPDPLAVLQELNRVLKPGGILFYSGPIWYEEHEQPYDFYRYTQFALRHLFAKAAFEVEDLRWLEGYLATVTRQLRRMASAMPLSFSAYGGGIAGVPIYMLGLNLKIFARLTAFAFAYAASRARYTAKGYPINYLAIVRRLP